MWEELYEDHYQELVAYGTRISGSKELAEDLTQETFVKALMNGDTVMDLSPGRTCDLNTQRIGEYRKWKMPWCCRASVPRIGRCFSCGTSTAIPPKKSRK